MGRTALVPALLAPVSLACGFGSQVLAVVRDGALPDASALNCQFHIIQPVEV